MAYYIYDALTQQRGRTMSDGFSDAERKAAWWATDSRRAVNGGLIDVIREKRGEKAIDDLSEVEAVQMGLAMQPTLGKLFSQQSGIGVRDLDWVGTHATHTWLKAHGDFETNDGGLLEVKNFNAASFPKYPDPDADPMDLPEPDIVQCVHEAVVFNKPHVWFAVLFGGQRFRYWKIIVTDEMKEDHIKRAAAWWAMAQTGELPDAETIEQARYKYRKENGGSIIASNYIESVILGLQSIKERIKELEEWEEKNTVILQNYMADKAEIRNIAGEVMVSWKQAKASKRFSADLFKKSQPALYESFVVEQPGSRRFLVK